MSNLISKDALEDEIQKLYHKYNPYDSCELKIVSGIMDVEELVQNFPTVVALVITKEEIRHLINDTISYIDRLEERGMAMPEFGYNSRKVLLDKLKNFRNEHFDDLMD